KHVKPICVSHINIQQNKIHIIVLQKSPSSGSIINLASNRKTRYFFKKNTIELSHHWIIFHNYYMYHTLSPSSGIIMSNTVPSPFSDVTSSTPPNSSSTRFVKNKP